MQVDLIHITESTYLLQIKVLWGLFTKETTLEINH